MSGSAFAVTHHAFSSGAGRTADRNRSHWSTSKTPSYTKSVSWQHHQIGDIDPRGETADFTSVSDKARAIGGGVLEALMMLMHQGVKATKEVLEVA